jgi:predicted MPP superfamily phosphohydrolase
MLHEPDFADQYARDGRVCLQLSGHTHGGQVRIPGIGGPFRPEYGRKYDDGLVEIDGMWLYTTRGVGVIGPPARFNCRPEITEITLQSIPVKLGSAVEYGSVEVVPSSGD